MRTLGKRARRTLLQDHTSDEVTVQRQRSSGYWLVAGRRRSAQRPPRADGAAATANQKLQWTKHGGEDALAYGHAAVVGQPHGH